MMCKLKRTDGGGSLGKECPSKDIRICKIFIAKENMTHLKNLKIFSMVEIQNIEMRMIKWIWREIKYFLFYIYL